MRVRTIALVCAFPILGLAIVLAAQRGALFASVAPLDDNVLVSITGGEVNNYCKTTESCDTLCKYFPATTQSRYCDGTSTDAWCKCHSGKNCTTSGSFACGQKLECEDLNCMVMCGDIGSCSFGKATASSDSC